MIQQHRDIITAIGRKQPITTAGIAEYLMDHFGYGGGMEFDAFRDQVSKIIGYLKSKGEIVGYDAPQEKGKPLRHWLLANNHPDTKPADHSEHDIEMASDVAEVEAVAETTTPEPVSVEAKVTHKPHMTVQEVLDNYPYNVLEPHMFFAYCAGIKEAEKHHGIGQ